MARKEDQQKTIDVKKANIDYYDSLQAGPARRIAAAEASRIAGMVASRAGSPERKYSRILEVGSGTGWLSCMIVASGLADSAVATDISGGMLRACREAAALNGLSVAQAKCDTQKLPFRDNSFDMVCGGGFLHHLENEVEFFHEAMRALAPGGALLIFREPQTIGSGIVTAIVKALTFLPAIMMKVFRKRGKENLEHELEKTYSAAALIKYGKAAGFDVAICGGHSFLHSIHWYLSTKLGAFPAANAVMKSLLPAADWIDEKVLERILPGWMFYEISACFVKKINSD